MVTLTHSAASRRMLRPSRLLLAAATFLFASVTADAQGRAHLSDDLQQHLDAGDATATTVIVTGTPDQIAAIAARHGLGVRRLLTSGAVLEVPAGRLDELAADADVPQLSGDHVIHGQMAVTDVSVGADQAWADIAVGSGVGRTNDGAGKGITGNGVGVAILDSGVTIVPELKGQVSARVDMMDRKGTGADQWGHGTHLAGIIAGAGSLESNGRGVAPGAHLVSVKVLGADGSGHISDLIEGIERACVHVPALRADDDRRAEALRHAADARRAKALRHRVDVRRANALRHGVDALRHTASLRQTRFERAGLHSALTIGGDADDLAGSDAEHPQRPDDRDVHFVADEDTQRWGAIQAVGFDVPARPPQHLVARGSESCKVRHVAPGHESHTRSRRQAEQVEQPCAGDLFDDRCRGRQHVKAGRLIPDRRQPFCGDRRR